MEEKNKINKVILGLNISISTIGISLVLNEEKLNIIDITHFKLNVSNKGEIMDELFAKSELFEEKINKYKNYPIDTVIIEDGMCRGGNIVNNEKLIRFSTMISTYIYKILNIKPIYISSYEARKYGLPHLMCVRRYNKSGLPYSYIKIKKDLNDGNLVPFGEYEWSVGKKEIVWDFISEKYPNIKWRYDKMGNPTRENFDSSDSLLSIIGYLSKLKYKDTVPEIVSVDERDVDNGCIVNYVVKFCDQLFEHRIEFKEKNSKK